MPEYLEVVESNKRMKGKGAPRDTLFGVLGHTMADSHTRSLGGLMITTTKGASPVMAAEKVSSVKKNTERHLVGGKHATAIPGIHMGQVPYPGMFMKAVGGEMS